jgi:hypothetical protein
VRFGTDHHERLDPRAERSLIFFPDANLETFSFWRYWAGFDSNLGPKLRLEGELAAIDAVDADFTKHWWVRLTRYDPFRAGSDIAFTVYNLDGAGLDGLGGLLSARWLMRRWSFRAALGLSTADSAAGDLSVTEARLHADYQLSSQWLLQGSFSRFFGDGLDSTLFQLGLTYRW